MLPQPPQNQNSPTPQELRQFFAHPDDRPWNPDFAHALLHATAGGLGRLRGDTAWRKTLIATRDPRLAAYEQAVAGVDDAYLAQDLSALARACRQWWKAAQALQPPVVASEEVGA